MNLEDLEYQRSKIEKDNKLTNEEKIIRLRVIQTSIERINLNKKYKEIMKSAVEDGEKLESISPAFRMLDTIEETKEELNYKMLNSEVVEYIDSRGIDNFSYDDFKDFVKTFEYEKGKKLPDIELSCTLYDKLSEAEKEEENEMNIIRIGLGHIVGDDLVGNYSFEIRSDGKIGTIDKTKEELDKSLHDAKEKIDELYVNEGLLDKDTASLAKSMVTSLFNYYKNGNKKIPKNIQSEYNNTNEYHYEREEKKM